MVIQVRPSDIYIGFTGEQVDKFITDNSYVVVDFRIVKNGETVLFFNSGKLSIGEATVKYVVYPRLILKNVPNNPWYWE